MSAASMSTWRWYSSWLISSAVRSAPSCSAAIHTSAASSTTFLPMACTPASRAATVPDPGGRVRAFSASSAYRPSNVFTRAKGTGARGDRSPPSSAASADVGRLHPTLRLGALGAGDLDPLDEAVDDEHPVEGVHHGGRHIAGGEAEGHADQVDPDPGQPELVPAPGHRVGGDDRAHEDPGVAPVEPPLRRVERVRRGLPEGYERLVDENGADQPEGDDRDPLTRAHPARDDRRGVDGSPHPAPVLRPADPAVDADDDEEDLTAGLAVQRDPLVGPEGGADVDEEQHDVGHDADRPGPHEALHAEPGGGDADRDADQLEPVQLVLADGDGRVDDLLEEVLRRVSGRRKEGVHEGCSSFGFVVLLGRTPGTCTTGGPAVDRPPAQPSYVLPTIRTFTVGPGVTPGQPAAGCGRVADCHRRLGVSPTPEHVGPVWRRVTGGTPSSGRAPTLPWPSPRISLPGTAGTTATRASATPPSRSPSSSPRRPRPSPPPSARQRR